MESGNDRLQSRIRGIVFGTSYGDAIGAVVEKLSFKEIKDKYGLVTNLNQKWYKHDWAPELRNYRVRGEGTITDDTLMTLALMEVYNVEKRHIDSYDMGKEFVKEIAFKPRYIPEFKKEALIIDRLFYPEKHIFLRHTLANCDPRQGGIGNMVNCGAAMYIAPIGIVNAGNPGAAYNEGINFAMGHQISYGLEAAGVLAACVAKAIIPGTKIEEVIETAIIHAKDGTKKAIEKIYEKALEIKEKREDYDSIVKEFHEVIKEFSPMGDDVNRSIDKLGIPSDHYTPSRLYSIEELPLALGFIVVYDGDFKKSMIAGINSGRDTDSIGVMIGAILGAMYGETIINDEELKILEETSKQKLLENSDKFYKTAKEIIENDFIAEQKRRTDISKIFI